MASTTLRLVFLGTGSKKVNFNYPDADSDASASQVKSLMEMIVDNGEIFAEVPITLESATFVTNTSMPVDIR